MAQPLPDSYWTTSTFTGSNIEIIAGSADDQSWDHVNRFYGTPGRDTWVGGGTSTDIFTGSAGNDVFAENNADDSSFFDYVDYGAAPGAVVVNLTGFDGRTETFTDQSGDVRTVPIKGGALGDGYGGIDYYMKGEYEDTSVIENINGSKSGDLLIGDVDWNEINGNGGNDTIIGNGGGDHIEGDEGNDVIRLGPASEDYSSLAYGGAGSDTIYGSDGADLRLRGNSGNDVIYAGGGDDDYVTGEAGNDFVDGGAGNDFIDGGIGADTLFSGAGTDFINPDIEYFQVFKEDDPAYPTDGARDVIRITRDDMGDYQDFVISRAFEPGIDKIHFAGAVLLAKDFRVYYENATIDERTGNTVYTDDPNVQNTVLQIDYNRNGFDAGDYFMSVLDVTLHQEGFGFTLS